MYLKDKNRRITLRLNLEQHEFIINMANLLDVSPSDYLRMIVNGMMFNVKMKGEDRRANEETNINDIL